jgi:hypothetical protein
LYLVPLALSVEAKPFRAAHKAIHRDRLIRPTRSHHIIRYVQKAGECAALLPKTKQAPALPWLSARHGKVADADWRTKSVRHEAKS